MDNHVALAVIKEPSILLTGTGQKFDLPNDHCALMLGSSNAGVGRFPFDLRFLYIPIEVGFGILVTGVDESGLLATCWM